MTPVTLKIEAWSQKVNQFKILSIVIISEYLKVIGGKLSIVIISEYLKVIGGKL